jgi:hypothetical protein
MRLGACLAVTMAAVGLSAAAAAAPTVADEPQNVAAAGDGFAPRLGFALLAGAALPGCDGQPEACATRLPVSPAVTGLVLFEPNRRWAVGLMQEVTRVSWQTHPPSPNGLASTRTLDAELTTAFVAVVSRLTLAPERTVAPFVQVALGDGLQSETGGFVSCNGKLNPTGQLGLGARGRVGTSWAVFALASATAGVRGGPTCAVADGPPATPFAAWGYGLQVGAAFDLALAGPRATAVAAR